MGTILQQLFIMKNMSHVHKYNMKKINIPFYFQSDTWKGVSRFIEF